MRHTHRRRFTPAVGILAFALAVLIGLLGAAFIPVSHTDNGRRIFMFGTTLGGRVVENSHGMEGVGCAMCHGAAGRGGTMHGIAAPDITFSQLIDPQGHDHEETGRRHPAFNRETIKAAIVAGIDPAGNTLDEEMPRWTGLSGKDLDDLIGYLMVLSQGHRPRRPAPQPMSSPH
jgi:mono/diheme cytochrome c family protein